MSVRCSFIRSATMAADLDQFQQLLNTLLSTDNDARTQAEEAYNNLPVDSKVTFLLTSLCNTTLTEEMRAMAAVLLRRLFSSEFVTFYPKMPPEAQAQFKEQILLSVQNEQTESIRGKVCEVAAEVARNLIDDDGNNEWPEFLQFLFQCANSPVPSLKENALRMFTSVPRVFGNQQANYLHLIKQMLQQSVMDSTNYEVRFQAVRAIGAFIILHDTEENIQKHFSELLPAIIQVIAQSVEKQGDDALLKVLIELAESTPKFLRLQLETIMEMCMKIFSNEDMADSWRQLALEVLVTLAETAPATVRKVGGKYIATLVPLVLKMMTDIEEDEKWSFSDEIFDEDNDSNNVVAESALDRLACGLGGKTILPQIVQNIPSMLSNSDWKYRHAALMAISAVGEGCHKQMEAILPQIMDGVIQYLQDPHPRVRYAACNAVGQMSTDFAPIFEKKFHDRVIPGLLMVLDDNANPRIQAHAGAALVNFSEDCPKNILTPYLDAIMAKLESILTAKFQELVEKGTKLVLEQVVTTIASVADTCEEQFVTYYDRLMPCLKYIIQNANQQEHKMLRGKTIECVSLIGLAVGPEKFIADASQVMDMLLKTHSEGDLPDDDPQTSYLISAWARICKILGKQFEQYLPLVMGPVLRTAAMQTEVVFLDNEDMEGMDDVDWEFISLGEQQNFGIKTAGLEDKASACEMLVCYARELKEGFADYAEEVVRLMVPMLKYYFHDGVRTAAAASLPYLLDCAKIKGPQYLEGMWAYICPNLLRAIDTEPESEVLLELLYSLAKCIETLGAGCLAAQPMAELLRILDKLLNKHFERAVARLEKRKDEDYDEVVEEQLADEGNEDVHTLSKIADILHALFTTHKSSFFPYFDQICGHFVKLLSPERSWSDHQWALCVFDDVIEFGGPECAKYQEYFLRPMIQYVSDKSAEVRQAAAYGCGVLGQYGGEAFAQACAEALPRLMEVINDPESRSFENVNPTENAISAVTKILKYNNKAINVDEILPHWLSWLPVVEDEDEAPYVYGYLCDLIEANHVAVLGPNNANLPRLISFFAEALYKDAVPTNNPVMGRILSIVRQIQNNESMFQACINALTADQQQALHEALRAQPTN
ncbi:PREDICTED: importin-5 isoform X3 [Eufriesea mexicana]|uniref:importin-5 isoform X2 n=2 Tax=Eufriesea mexicana TaxID=516756 RepID=UPI00083C81D6|nr:PREDICTED: importin-5 isoform X2 [Eufriesea mexicana]XP_017765334.1 PREDICTED: importin-5 isoform X3 [Eufriesea mexicana]